MMATSTGVWELAIRFPVAVSSSASIKNYQEKFELIVNENVRWENSVYLFFFLQSNFSVQNENHTRKANKMEMTANPSLLPSSEKYKANKSPLKCFLYMIMYEGWISKFKLNPFYFGYKRLTFLSEDSGWQSRFKELELKFIDIVVVQMSLFTCLLIS